MAIARSIRLAGRKLSGQTDLIMLDELPPYLENASTTARPVRRLPLNTYRLSCRNAVIECDAAL
jgi:hypothetical protein